MSGTDPSGEVLPDRTRDEDPVGWSDYGWSEDDDTDDHLRREVPPHHR